MVAIAGIAVSGTQMSPSMLSIAKKHVGSVLRRWDASEITLLFDVLTRICGHCSYYPCSRLVLRFRAWYRRDSKAVSDARRAFRESGVDLFHVDIEYAKGQIDK